MWGDVRYLVLQSIGIGISIFLFNSFDFTKVIGYKIITILEPHVHGKLRSGWHFKGHDNYDRSITAFGAGHRFLVFATSKTSVMTVLVRCTVNLCYRSFENLSTTYTL